MSDSNCPRSFLGSVGARLGAVLSIVACASAFVMLSGISQCNVSCEDGVDEEGNPIYVDCRQCNLTRAEQVPCKADTWLLPDRMTQCDQATQQPDLPDGTECDPARDAWGICSSGECNAATLTAMDVTHRFDGSCLVDGDFSNPILINVLMRVVSEANSIDVEWTLILRDGDNRLSGDLLEAQIGAIAWNARDEFGTVAWIRRNVNSPVPVERGNGKITVRPAQFEEAYSVVYPANASHVEVGTAEGNFSFLFEEALVDRCSIFLNDPDNDGDVLIPVIAPQL